jgi:hypothetical protein
VRARAFGLDLDAEYEIPGLDDAGAAAGPPGRAVRLGVVPAAELPRGGHPMEVDGF